MTLIGELAKVKYIAFIKWMSRTPARIEHVLLSASRSLFDAVDSIEMLLAHNSAVSAANSRYISLETKANLNLWQSRQQSPCNELTQLLYSFEHLKCGTRFRLQKQTTQLLLMKRWKNWKQTALVVKRRWSWNRINCTNSLWSNVFLWFNLHSH